MQFNAYNFMSITAGDYDGDGIDDLAVVSYPGVEAMYEINDKGEDVTPQLYGALGKGEGKHIVIWVIKR